MEKVGDGIHRLGSYWVNFFVLEEGDGLTVVDTGFPGYVDQLSAWLKQLGRKPSDVKAIVLTHTHSDHIGGAPTFMQETGAPVLVPEGEAAVATGEEKPVNPKGVLSGFAHASMYKFVRHLISNKGLSKITVPEVTPYGTDEVLDVPGKPRVVYTPGHSTAHSALMLEDRKVLICGDAMATLDVGSGATGPMVHPFNQDRGQAIRSLDVLAKVDAEVLLPGHGEPWRGVVSEAVAAARRSATSSS